jgi:hypothetical protein
LKLPITLWDMGLWLGYMSFMLLVTSQFLTFSYLDFQIRINKNRFKIISLLISITFAIIMIINISQ